MNIGIAQINTTVGDLTGNAELILEAYAQLSKKGAELIVFPELTISGYPPMDLLLKPSFVKQCEQKAAELASQFRVPTIIGCPTANPSKKGNMIFNSAFVCERGQIIHTYHKRLLPTYDVFDERRYFEPGSVPGVFEIGDQRIGLTICEDIWVDPSTRKRYDHDPVEELAKEGVSLIVNLSASPWHVHKTESRLKYLTRAAQKCNCPVVYCNSVGGNDELIFDGSSKIINSDGLCLHILKRFDAEITAISLKDLKGKNSVELDESEHQEILDALILGLKDYTRKTGFKKAVIGLSGGIDSAVTAYVAAAALGPENVTGVSLPSRISSQHSKDDAADLAKNLGIRFHTVEIGDVVDSIETSLKPLFEGMPLDVTEENIQARARGILLMAMSNKFGSILLTTGNKSEMAVGYCTLYGDMAGGLAILSDVLKTVVYDVARYINRDREIIPYSTIEKPPSAELRPDQKDEDSLPPYPVLDEILSAYIEDGMTRKDMIEKGMDPELVEDIAKKVDRNEYKRKQAPPGLKITSLAFGIGRRIPIAQRFNG
jgi:NAD+ synthase (glutamine-hydrolysing)